MKNEVILELKQISKKFNDELVFDNISLQLKKGEVVSISGKSGQGKSTLLKCLNLLEEFDSGEVLLNGKNIKDINIVELRQSIGLIFQDYNLFDHLNVIDNLTIGLIKIKKYSEEKSKKLAIEMLKKVGLENKKYSYPDELSGGQKQRVSIARTLLMKPKIILLDEPTSALDEELKNEVLKLIMDLVKEDMTLVIVSHEQEFISKISDKIFKLETHNLLEIKK